MRLRAILVKSVWQARAGTQDWFGAVNMILGTWAYLKITHSEAPAPSRSPASQLPFAVNPSNQHTCRSWNVAVFGNKQIGPSPRLGLSFIRRQLRKEAELCLPCSLCALGEGWRWGLRKPFELGKGLRSADLRGEVCRGLVSSPEAACRGKKAFFGSQGDVVCSLPRALALVSA